MDLNIAGNIQDNLKQHYVTLTATRGFKKRNLTMYVHTSHKTANLVKSSHFMEKMSSGIPTELNSDSQRFLKATCRLPAERNSVTEEIILTTIILRNHILKIS